MYSSESFYTVFYSSNFTITKDVLIPHPFTECLAKVAIDY